MTHPKEERPNKYIIGNIAIDANGKYWVSWWGSHAEQGGMAFTKGSWCMDNIEDLLNIVGRNIQECVDNGMYAKIIADREKERQCQGQDENQ